MSANGGGPGERRIPGDGPRGSMMDPKKTTDTFAALPAEPGPDGAFNPPPPVVAEARAAAVPSAATANYDWLGASLRRMYDDVLNEPIPDSFVDLLKQLYEQQKRRRGP